MKEYIRELAEPGRQVSILVSHEISAAVLVAVNAGCWILLGHLLDLIPTAVGPCIPKVLHLMVGTNTVLRLLTIIVNNLAHVARAGQCVRSAWRSTPCKNCRYNGGDGSGDRDCAFSAISAGTEDECTRPPRDGDQCEKSKWKPFG